jgi:protein PsiE
MSEHQVNPRILRATGRALVWLEIVGLVVIALATLVAGVEEVTKMIAVQQVTLADLLLLFIYLEVLTMVTAYLDSGALPIRMPLYIAMVALARHLILDMKEMSEWAIIATAVAILVIAIAVLAIRFGHVRFPYELATKGGTRQVTHD